MPLLQLGPIRLAVLNADGTKQKTLFLPTPSRGYPQLEWDEKAKTWELDDAGELTRFLGYLPVLTVRWSVYSTRDQGYVEGTANGQMPSLEDLLMILSQPSGRLRVSPGRSAGGFTADRALVRRITKQGAFYAGIEVTFRARTARSTRDLEVF